MAVVAVTYRKFVHRDKDQDNQLPFISLPLLQSSRMTHSSCPCLWYACFWWMVSVVLLYLWQPSYTRHFPQIRCKIRPVIIITNKDICYPFQQMVSNGNFWTKNLDCQPQEVKSKITWVLLFIIFFMLWIRFVIFKALITKIWDVWINNKKNNC